VPASDEPSVVTLEVQPPTGRLAQASAGGSASNSAWVYLPVGLIIAVVVAVYWRLDASRARLEKQHADRLQQSHEREAKQGEEYHAAALQKAKVEHALASTELKMREIELGEGEGLTSRAELNKLMGKKMQLEIDLLSTQLELARRELALRGDQMDFHDVQMERARLEIESLKLRIREQRKGLDEFGGE
jgi:hypothetical protein